MPGVMVPEIVKEFPVSKLAVARETPPNHDNDVTICEFNAPALATWPCTLSGDEVDGMVAENTVVASYFKRKMGPPPAVVSK